MTSNLMSDLANGNKSALLKKQIITYYINNVTSTIPELSKELNLSVPTVTKLIKELCDDSVLDDYGKSDSKGGRRPSTYGLNPDSGYFLGVDIKNRYINIGLSNFKGTIVKQDFDIPIENFNESPATIISICNVVNEFIDRSDIKRAKIYNGCVNISGRVNPYTGYSRSLFNFSEIPLTDILTERLNIPVCIDNDTRTMAYGEFLQGVVNGEKNILYINLSWGLGLGIILNGEIYGGKSGFAGELGHVNVFDNEIICHCGKKGCLETEVSGSALYRMLVERIQAGQSSVITHDITQLPPHEALNDIVDAINNEDLLCIELLEEIGQKLGRQIAGLINIFNPEIVVIGGVLSATGDNILQPVKSAVRKYSLNLVNKDSKIVCSRLHEKAGIIGACMMARRRMFEEIS